MSVINIKGLRLGFTAVAVLLTSWVAADSEAREVAGIRLAENSQNGDHSLVLNGAGIRSKFFFKIYVGALYLSKKNSDADAILLSDSAKTVLMHFVYKEVSKEKLVSAWNEGFSANLSNVEFNKLKAKIDQFNALFKTVKKDDRILIHYQPGVGTQILFNDKPAGTIEGFDFHQALLKIWIGKNPVTSDLKNAMLGK